MTENGHEAMTVLATPLSSAAFFTPSLLALKKSTNDIATSVGRLSSGNRIANIGDDVASFSIAVRLQSQLSGLRQSSQNVAQGSSLLQVADGGLQQISELLDNLKALAVQANTSSLLETDRSFLQHQFTGFLDEIDRIATETTFNDVDLLDGTFDEDFRVGDEAGNTINVDIDGVTTDDLFVSLPDISSQANAADAEDDIDTASNTLQTIISTVGALQARFVAAADNLTASTNGVDAARSALADTDIPTEASNLALTTVRFNVATAVIAQAHNLQSNLVDVLKFSVK